MTKLTSQIEQIRAQFPILKMQSHAKPLVYLDNAATSQKPQAVIDRVQTFYAHENATVHRGFYELSQATTEAYEAARRHCQRFLNAAQETEIIFVRGATEAINLVAAAFGGKFIKAGDEIVISEMEHHANIVPWQRLCEQVKAKLVVIPVEDDGALNLPAYQKLLNARTKLVAITHVSNVLGSVVPVEEIIKAAHRVGAKVLVDGAQAAPHMAIDVQALDCDFYCFSGHKIYGPTGIGVLYGKYALLDEMDPYQTGGAMIERVSFEGTTYLKPPAKFEAGTPAVAEIMGLDAALTFIDEIGLNVMGQMEHKLLKQATAQLTKIPGLRIIGSAAEKVAVISFILKDFHPHDVATILDQEGICVRSGHHCAQPLMQRFGVSATVRASFAFYNTSLEIERLVAGLKKAISILK